MDDGNLKPGETISPRKIENKTVPQQAPQPVSKMPVAQAPVISEAPKSTALYDSIVNAPQPVAPLPITTDATVTPTAPTQTINQSSQVNDQTNLSEQETLQNVSPSSEDQTNSEEGPAINWTASEFIAHEKSLGWYLVLVIIALAVSALVFYMTKDKISVGVVIFGAIVMGFFAARKPRQLDYMIDDAGVSVGQKRYFFEDFKSFGVVPEGAFSSIIFMPHKRFAVPINIYYPPENEQEITEVIGLHLPLEEHKYDVVDRLMRAIRF